jgi:hypothetical protein
MKPNEWLVVAGRFAIVALGLAATVATVAAISGSAHLRPRWPDVLPQPGEWDARWSSVRVGMTREQVLGLLGSPVQVARHAERDACAEAYDYPDYSNGPPTCRLCFDLGGRLTSLYPSGMQFDLRTMADGGGFLEEVPALAAAALVMGALVGVAAIVSRRSNDRPTILR